MYDEFEYRQNFRNLPFAKRASLICKKNTGQIEDQIYVSKSEVSLVNVNSNYARTKWVG